MTKYTKKRIQTGKMETNYWEAGSGSPLILLHGGGAGADAWGNWNKVFDLYAEQGFHVFAYDAIGFGKTERLDPNDFEYSQEARADQLLDFIDALGLEKASVVGNSMGGLTSMGAALKKPNKIDKMILMGAGKPNANSEGRKALLGYKPEKESMVNIVRHLTNPDFNVNEEMVNHRFNLTQLPMAMDTYRAVMKGIFDHDFTDAELKQIEHTSLLVHGTLDKMVPLERSYHLLDVLPNAWLYAMPHCGHWAMMEYPAEFTRVTSDFIKNH